ncbi:YHS domain protein [Fibrisoma limi BUZ 3]|uniref:YHS domain protein n=1 Tax=Fibrisoma limi BUZ 3 TaxID=1185876 RepID=I2GIG0_9BACT|nr:YHS domain-containing (seleno)protein [Fibrisoma limi]CCH53685.1 YHS domain protein [Fibrisoma limi BUZ 3]
MKTTVIALMLGCLLTQLAFAQVPQRTDNGKYLQNLDENGCAAQGYDCVALVTIPDKLVKGSAEFQSEYQGAKFWFASAANKATFDANPDKFAPLYGGFCAIAVAEGNLRPVQIWTHRVTPDGHLTLNHNAKALKLWEARLHHNYKLAQKNWPTVSQKPAQYDILHKGETQQTLAATSFEGPKK